MDVTKTPINIGILGCGYATTKFHLPALQSLQGIKIAALADVNPARLEQVAQMCGGARRYVDSLSLMDDPGVDVVLISVPPGEHAQLAQAGLAAGKHLLIEKPLALDLDQAEGILQAAAESRTKTMVGHNLRFHHQVIEAKRVISEGLLGPIQFVRAVTSGIYPYQHNLPDWRKHRDQGGGVLIDLAIHHFDMARFVLESELEEVSVLSRSGEVDDVTATTISRMANGVLTSSTFSQRAAPSNEVEFAGLDGRLSISLYQNDGFQYFPSSSLAGVLRKRVRRVSNTLQTLPRAVVDFAKGGVFFGSYQNQWRHFIHCIREDAPVGCSLEEGVHSLRAVLACLASAAEKRTVRIAEAPRRVIRRLPVHSPDPASPNRAVPCIASPSTRPL